MSLTICEGGAFWLSCRQETAEQRNSLQPFAGGTIVTTSHFSKAALIESAERGKHPIHLLDGFELSRTIITNKAEALLAMH